LPAAYVPTLRNIRVLDLALQADGACLAAGDAGNTQDLKWSMGRVAADGTDDTGFVVRTDFSITKIALQEDGRPVIAGAFSRVNGNDVARRGLVRLNNEPSVSVLSRTGNTTVRWMRGGTAPEVSDVSFEMNTPGGADDAWSLLGFGTRTPGGWELTGLNLPGACRLRACGRAGGSLTQAMVSYSGPLEAWRLTHFNTSANAGDAADDADPDHDGLTNFAEFAFGLPPVDRGGSALPEFTLTDDGFTTAFTAPDGRDADVIYRAAWSPTMTPGTWTNIPDTGTAPLHVFRVPAASERVFVRWEVSLR
jgi:hypothetical protein